MPHARGPRGVLRLLALHQRIREAAETALHELPAGHRGAVFGLDPAALPGHEEAHGVQHHQRLAEAVLQAGRVAARRWPGVRQEALPEIRHQDAPPQGGLRQPEEEGRVVGQALPAPPRERQEFRLRAKAPAPAELLLDLLEVVGRAGEAVQEQLPRCAGQGLPGDAAQFVEPAPQAIADVAVFQVRPLHGIQLGLELGVQRRLRAQEVLDQPVEVIPGRDLPVQQTETGPEEARHEAVLRLRVGVAARAGRGPEGLQQLAEAPHLDLVAHRRLRGAEQHVPGAERVDDAPAPENGLRRCLCRPVQQVILRAATVLGRAQLSQPLRQHRALGLLQSRGKDLLQLGLVRGHDSLVQGRAEGGGKRVLGEGLLAKQRQGLHDVGDAVARVEEEVPQLLQQLRGQRQGAARVRHDVLQQPVADELRVEEAAHALEPKVAQRIAFQQVEAALRRLLQAEQDDHGDVVVAASCRPAADHGAHGVLGHGVRLADQEHQRPGEPTLLAPVDKIQGPRAAPLPRRLRVFVLLLLGVGLGADAAAVARELEADAPHGQLQALEVVGAHARDAGDVRARQLLRLLHRGLVVGRVRAGEGEDGRDEVRRGLPGGRRLLQLSPEAGEGLAHVARGEVLGLARPPADDAAHGRGAVGRQLLHQRAPPARRAIRRRVLRGAAAPLLVGVRANAPGREVRLAGEALFGQLLLRRREPLRLSESRHHLPSPG
mmetsp:Transcript_23348/g.69529  ORF Transcript_23348/g.69529 Transcript_23348/m.69529 type:complete len:716 (-) Transcript_23348:39-2186(-)